MMTLPVVITLSAIITWLAATRWEWVTFGWCLVGGCRRNTDGQLFKITVCLKPPSLGLTNAFAGHECPPSPLLPPSSLRTHEHFPWLGAASASQVQGRWRGGRWKVGDRGGEGRAGIGLATSAAEPSIVKRQRRPASVHLICGWMSRPSVVILGGDYWPGTLLSLTRFA